MHKILMSTNSWGGGSRALAECSAKNAIFHVLPYFIDIPWVFLDFFRRFFFSWGKNALSGRILSGGINGYPVSKMTNNPAPA